MKKNLSEIDQFYAILPKSIGVKERVQYCSSLIYHTESFVTKNIQELSERLKKKSFEIIIAAEREMDELNRVKRTA